MRRGVVTPKSASSGLGVTGTTESTPVKTPEVGLGFVVRDRTMSTPRTAGGLNEGGEGSLSLWYPEEEGFEESRRWST